MECKNDMTNKYIRFPLHKVLEVTCIYTAFFTDLSRAYKSVGESHDFWELVYVETGNLLCVTDNECFELHASDFCLHPPKEFHQHINLSNKTTTILIISFSLEVDNEYYMDLSVVHRKSLSEYFQKELSLLLKYSTHVFCSISATEDFLEQHGYESQDLRYEQLLKNGLEQFLLKLLILKGEEKAEPIANSHIGFYVDKQSTNLFKCVSSYMKENIYTRLSIHGLCSNFGYSKTTLCCAFQKEVGKGPMQYYNSLKIEKAKELISSSSANITEISNLLNFSTPSYFSKIFKKYVGLYPSQYQKSIKKDLSVIMMHH